MFFGTRNDLEVTWKGPEIDSIRTLKNVNEFRSHFLTKIN